MRKLHHNGVYLPKYSPVGLKIKYQGTTIPLDETTERMAIAIVRKLDTPYIKDNVFVRNFLIDFTTELSKSLPKPITGGVKLEDFDFSEIINYLEEVKSKTEAMTREEKKLATKLKKELREALKKKYGYAQVDGKTIALQNWTVEPPSIYLSKGTNPLRGKWKREIKPEDITLNLSPDAPQRNELMKQGFKITWEPESMWIAKWPEVFDRTRYKYVWFSPTSTIRQNKDKEKFDIALKVEKEIDKIDKRIAKDLRSKDLESRKLALVVYLMRNLAIRVGDEKIAGERGTIGATTLKPENVRFEGNKIILDFTGKDFVKWHRELETNKQVIQVFKELIDKANEDYIFKGLNSAKVSKYLKSIVPKTSAKVFRTFIAGVTWDQKAKETLKFIDIETPLPIRKYLFKMTNLAVAQKLNHKKALPKNYEERVKKKEQQLNKEFEKLLKLTETTEEKYMKQEHKAIKIACDLALLKETAEWNLNTSLTSYIDPRKVLEYLEKAKLDINEVYSKTLQEKFAWARGRNQE